MSLTAPAVGSVLCAIFKRIRHFQFPPCCDVYTMAVFVPALDSTVASIILTAYVLVESPCRLTRDIFFTCSRNKSI